ncbi:D-amino acid dehydrogenase small subunit [Nitzschia inconspicua]|uniref:D-amino acid dehydrogenase small subunit n=1 Tax=Nitzschia inconspicua TaxID=303405 RepID=A0A9K3KC88_9STRA|nr:D-amino acid dehydrogenase small subunit [Nitzschia inconspicua]
MFAAFFIQSGTAAVAGVTAMTYFRYKHILKRQDRLPKTPFRVFDDEHKRTFKPVIVIGAGVVGVATAYQLAKRGYSVAVLEPMDAPGEECSACAAGGMQRSNPVVDRDSWVAVAKCLTPHWARPTRNFDFFHISWSKCLTDPFFLRWVATFTQTSLFPCDEQASKQADMLNFTNYAVTEMVKMLEKNRGYLGKRSGYNTRGSLSVTYDDVTLELPGEDNESQQNNSLNMKNNPTQSKSNLEPCKMLNGIEEVLREEPSLCFQKQLPTGAKYEYESKSASSGRFSKALAEICQNSRSRVWQLNNGGQVKFFYGTKVHGTVTGDKSSPVSSSSSEPSKVIELLTNRGTISCKSQSDNNNLVPIVVAAGAWVPHVMALMNYYAPVYPLTGYAMSVSAKEALQSSATDKKGIRLFDAHLPSRIVCDKYMYTTRLGDEIRITSIGEFSGWSTEPTPSVDKEFRHEAIRQFPQLEPFVTEAKTLCGHRPLVNDGILLLGRLSEESNVYISSGPGSNGWKLAMGSGEVIARMIEGQSTRKISQELGANVETFSPSGRVLRNPLFAKICRARWDV